MTNIDLFRQIIERGFNRGDLSVADEICAPGLIEHQYLTAPGLTGPAILKSQIAAARAQVRDLHLDIEDFVEAGGKVWVRMRAAGIDPCTARPIVMDVFDICAFEGGKLVEHWGVPDRFALLHQTGALLPKPA